MILDHFFTRQTRDSYQRSIAKTLSWRLLAACDTFAISYFVTGKIAGAATIVGVEGVTKIGWYFLHERGWQHITWGRIPPPTFRQVMAGLWHTHVKQPIKDAVAAGQAGGESRASVNSDGQTPPHKGGNSNG